MSAAAEGADLRPGPRLFAEDGDDEDAQPARGVGQEARPAGEEHVVVVRRHVQAVARREGLEVDGYGHGKDGVVDHPR